MKGIRFEKDINTFYHSYDDFGLILNSKEISAPAPKIKMVEVEGADGSLDFTEAFGDIKYENRSIKAKFSCLAPVAEFPEVFSLVQNTLHGRKFNIIFDDDPNYYYVGRVSIDKWKTDKSVGSFEMDIDCEPYKYHLYPTVRTNTITGTQTLVYTCDRMSVMPMLTADAQMSVVFGSKTVVIPADTESYSPDIVFKEGSNTMEITGEGTLTVEYQEGRL